MLETGDHLLVAHRRLFAEDHPRFFTGSVDGHELGVVMTTGFSWVRDAFTGSYEKNAGTRTKVFSLVSGSLIVYRLPRTCDMGSLEFVLTPDQGLWLRDAIGFEMDLAERHSGAARGGEPERRAS